jgi:hypothetical protein
MKKYLFKLSIVIVLLFFYINDCNAVTVVNPVSSTVARGLCKYTLSNGYYVDTWKLDYTACVQTPLPRDCIAWSVFIPLLNYYHIIQ